MELIKQIKQAEAQAQEIIDVAKVQAAGEAEQGRKRRLAALADAERERKRAIDAAVAAARADGLAKAAELKSRAGQELRQLRDEVAGRIPGTVAKVMSYLRG